ERDVVEIDDGLAGSPRSGVQAGEGDGSRLLESFLVEQGFGALDAGLLLRRTSLRAAEEPSALAPEQIEAVPLHSFGVRHELGFLLQVVPVSALKLGELAPVELE